VWRYAYDPFGRRIVKQCEGNVIRFVWDGDMILHEIEDPKRFSTWVFDLHSFQALCKIQGREFYSVISNGVGTPQNLVDTRGRVVWSGRYKAWGEREKHKDGEVSCAVRFPGQWYDEESGLHYNRARYYDPRNGRFISPDPIGVLGGLNLYQYAPNPINCIDPLGLCNGRSDRRLSDEQIRDMVARLRAGQDVTVENMTQARQLLDAMPDLRPQTGAGQMPITPGTANPRINPGNPFGGGPHNPMWQQPPGTYRGDLINPAAPGGPVHPDVNNDAHANNPHYNIVFSNGNDPPTTTAAIIIQDPQNQNNGSFR
jgi:RHS repeat-associated protein